MLSHARDDDGVCRERITFFARCAALEDLAYGRESGREEYTRAAERNLTWLFPETGTCLFPETGGRRWT